jgi:hypothetical protein
MQPQRPSGTVNYATTVRKSGPVGAVSPTYENAKKRVLAKLEDRMDMSASKRMPQSLLKQSLRQQAEQIADQEARGFAKPDRDRIVEEVLAELLGCGPLEELFADPTMREVMVTAPGVVIARREQGQWMPTSVKFRDEEHVRATLDRMATHADPIGPVIASMVVFDVRLPNGFRAIAMIPPEGLEQSATAAFYREATQPPPSGIKKEISGTFPGLPPASAPASAATTATSATGSASAGTSLPRPSTITASPRPGSGTTNPPGSRNGVLESPIPGDRDPLARHRQRILERLLSKFAAMKLYDISRIDTSELRKVIAAYIREYCTNEKIYMSDTDQGRVLLEILTSLQR